MQSSFRFLLAWLVVVAHLAVGTQLTRHFGVFAVFGFYLLSGYLMTLVLKEVYDFRLRAFAINRFLRLYPTYWLILIATLAMVLWAPEASGFHGAWAPMGRFVDWLGNTMMVPFVLYDQKFRLVPPAWSVAVELINYFLLWVFVARRWWTALFVVALGIVYHAWALYNVPSWTARYAPFYAALLPFALGSCIYYAGPWLERFQRRTMIAVMTVAITIWIANLFYVGASGGYESTVFNFGFYLNLAALCVLTAGFSHPDFRTPAKGWQKILGNLAFPVFLLHWQVGFLTGAVFLDGARRGWLLVVISAPFLLLSAWGVAWLADRMVEPLRDRVRPIGR